MPVYQRASTAEAARTGLCKRAVQYAFGVHFAAAGYWARSISSAVQKLCTGRRGVGPASDRSSPATAPHPALLRDAQRRRHAPRRLLLLPLPPPREHAAAPRAPRHPAGMPPLCARPTVPRLRLAFASLGRRRRRGGRAPVGREAAPAAPASSRSSRAPWLLRRHRCRSARRAWPRRFASRARAGAAGCQDLPCPAACGPPSHAGLHRRRRRASSPAPPLSLRLAAPLFLLLLPLLPHCGSGPVPPRGLRQARAGSGRLAATPPRRGRWSGAAPLRPAAARPRGGRHGPMRKGVRRRVEMKKKGGRRAAGAVSAAGRARQGPAPPRARAQMAAGEEERVRMGGGRQWRRVR
ncbi:hypothetical protein PVAP13_8KG063468 [Panicum virgatum]|uniref:Uncharacterized protein n=1 Tax=Panicum virgatum TaxID=38727 RepID=A0A8T0PDW9_PANVG|nr:hypothetical protein PVAP13_8KG063468 [Panicum virgatum]